MKKLLTMALMLVVLVCALAITASAVEHNGIYYSLNATNKTATVTNENVNCTLTEVVIPETITIDEVTYTVTKVDGSAFAGSDWAGNKVVTSVTIPKTVASIGTHVFRNCSALEEVVIEATGYNYETGEGNSEISFSNAEFYYCTNLVSVDMSKSNVVGLGSNCFTSCGKLTTVLFSSKIRSIGSSFTGCSSLTTINSIETLETISTGFYNTKITGDIRLPKIRSIGGSSFRGTGITSIDMSGAPLQNIDGHAFNACASLKTVILPEGVKTIGEKAFNGSSNIESINLPKSLTSIGGFAFAGLKAVTEINLPNLTHLGDNALQSTGVVRAFLPSLATAGKDIFNSTPIKMAVFGGDMSGITSSIFSSCGSLRVVIFLGEDGSVAKDKIDTLNSFTVKSFSEYDPSIDYASGSDKIIFDGLAKAGDSTESYICFESYDKAFYTYNITTNEKATYGAILTHLGFSTNSSKDGIATGYSINRESLNQYEDIYGKLEIGVAIFNPSYLGDGSFFVNGNELNVSKGALQVSIDTKYTTCNVYINGFNSTTSGLELVFASYAYLAEDKSTIELVQKLYEGTEQSPVSSPMQSLVVRGDASLYTVTLESILAPAEITAGKDALEEFGA